MNCPSCQAVNPDAKRFCGSCGAPLQRTCGACSATAPAEYQFCGSCGAPLADPVSSPAVAAAPDALTRYVPKGLAEKIPGAQFALIKGASHAAPWTAIETFLELMTTFLRTGTLPREDWEA